VTDLTNMIGFNYRMTEIEAAIASEQLKKLESLVRPRVACAEYLSDRLKDLPGLTPPVVRPGVRHGYYVYPMRYDARQTGVPRARIAEALRAEGIPCGTGYVRPLYLEPAYQERIGYGSRGFPFRCAQNSSAVSYARGLCPVCERMHFEELLSLGTCHANIAPSDLDDVVRAFDKVYENLGALRDVHACPT
jgi:dTDP-4-amino-4,6-dideoxygalactose transaminase